MKFSKWQGLGNDFVLVELGRHEVSRFPAEAQHWCDRHFGIGADGVVTIRPLGGTAFEMRIYNADGTEPEMCGNATRCVGLYIRKHKLAAGNEFELHTRTGIVRPKVLDNDSVRVDMGKPVLLHAQELTLQVPGSTLRGIAVSTGNPHVVIFVPDISAIPLTQWGPVIEKDAQFPAGTNVEFVEVISPQLVRMRVWERGCGVTLACGTGSCATVTAGVHSKRTDRHVTVLLDGGELQIDLEDHVYMTGPACEVFRGEWNV